MVKCAECGIELQQDARFCPNCGTQAGLKKDVYDVSAGGLVGKVKEILQDAKVKRIVVKDQKGKVLLSIPVTWGAAVRTASAVSSRVSRVRPTRQRLAPAAARALAIALPIPPPAPVITAT